MCNSLEEKEVYQKLICLSKSKDNSDTIISKVAEYIDYPSDKVRAKALWMLGELGLKNSQGVRSYISKIAESLENNEPKIRQRTVGALGRIGRGKFDLIKLYIPIILSRAKDSNPDVRMNFIWACENIATNTPDIFGSLMEIFAGLLDDDGMRVRRESPEIFRVIGKRRPDFVVPYISRLKVISETDPDEIVRIHANGAIKASTTL